DYGREAPGAAGEKRPPRAWKRAAKATKKGGAPHEKRGGLKPHPAAKVKELKAAATLEPRNSAYWQELARAQTAAEQYADANKSWVLAERNAINEADRERAHQARIDFEDERAAFEIAEKKRLAA